MTLLIGPQFVFTRTTGLLTHRGWFVPPNPYEPISEWGFSAGAIAGLDLRGNLNSRVAVVGRARARFTNRDAQQQRDGFGWFGMSSGLGLAIQF